MDVSTSGSETTVTWELSIVELSKMDDSSGEMERGLEASSSPYRVPCQRDETQRERMRCGILTFWEGLSFREESDSAPVLHNRCFFAESVASRPFSCSIGRLMAPGSAGLVPKAIFGLGRSSLEGNRRGVPSGDLVFASTGASARRLLGDAVFIVLRLRSIYIYMVSSVDCLSGVDREYLWKCISGASLGYREITVCVPLRSLGMGCEDE